MNIASSNVGDIKNNWPQYRCNPLVMPFAGYFGHDPAENFNECINLKKCGDLIVQLVCRSRRPGSLFWRRNAHTRTPAHMHTCTHTDTDTHTPTHTHIRNVLLYTHTK